jgi:hypothetical protein
MTTIAKPVGEAFGFLETSSYRVVTGVLVGLSVVELGAVHVILGAVFGVGHFGLHLALVAVNLSGIAWILGDARALGASHHVVGADTLSLRLGRRASADVPRDAILSAVATSGANDGGLRVTPLEEPNVALSFDREIPIATLFGRVRRARRLSLYVDRPDAFLAALARS